LNSSNIADQAAIFFPILDGAAEKAAEVKAIFLEWELIRRRKTIQIKIVKSQVRILLEE
jgi:hypothetical protein